MSPTDNEDADDEKSLFSASELPEQRRPKPPPPPGKKEICRPWITKRNGQRLYAWQLGKKAICFYVDA